MKRVLKVIAIILLFLGVSLLSIWLFYKGQASPGNLREILLSYLHPESSTVLELQGNVEVREVRLGFEVSGRISDMAAEEGDRVAPGQILAKLETDYFEDALRQAEAALEARKAELLKLKNGSRPEEIEQARATTLAARVAFIKAEKEFQRAQNLLPSGAVSKEVFDNAKAARDQAEAQLKAAEATQRLVERGPRQEDIARARAMVEEAWARLAEAQRRLEDTQLRSPTAGVIQTKVREVGDFVGIGEPVYVLSITNPVWVRAYVNEVDLGKIRPGMKAMVRTDAGQSFEGQVGFISPVAEFTPKTVETKEIRTDLVYRIRVIVQDP
ncbi:MAG TPA: HlyD family efflux transporter periplasmic adaptor subunit, partial [Acidobacteriota bacterium]|nr:HlyD family efflux transporter periplasmic adaptor subunit [Acidobacteriota bacterium]